MISDILMRQPTCTPHRSFRPEIANRMKPQLQISAKNLGAVALPSFCPRCFWLRIMCGGKLPFQTFPGIFSSIDSYSKRVTMIHFRKYGRVPKWFDGFGELGEPIAVPGWSRFQIVDPETNIILTGVPDEILRHPKNGITILDYKTARFTETQDALSRMYEVQLNCYGFIAAKIGFGPVCALGLFYYEPETQLKQADCDVLVRESGFFLRFSPKLKKIELDPNVVPPLLRQVREICDLPDSPNGRPDCQDCYILERLMHCTGRTASSFREDALKSLEALRREKQIAKKGTSTCSGMIGLTPSADSKFGPPVQAKSQVKGRIQNQGVAGGR